tara:strand:+ start:1552 stop:1755 length:204 start_codon:yes stop_codon:yes gene_type:complete
MKFTFRDWAKRIYGKKIDGPKNQIDKAWSLKDEAHLNTNNIIFQEKFELRRLLGILSSENDKLKKKR